VRGYLDPDRRGDRADEGEASQAYLDASLIKPQPDPATIDLLPLVRSLDPP
jgi:hypothetical protein